MSERNEKDEEKTVFDIAAGAGFDMRAYSVVLELKRMLSSVKDEGTNIDAGTGSREADLWVKIGGVEYYVSVRPSNNQLLSEGVSREELGLPPLSDDGSPTEPAA